MKTKHFSSNTYLESEYYSMIYPYVKGKTVLDVGCVGHNVDLANTVRYWSHGFLAEVTGKLIGIDTDVRSINKMKKMGFDVQAVSAEKIEFKNKFDVIFGGEIIEHLVNPGLFLEASKKALKPGGKIILTTPNTYSFARVFRAVQSFTNDPVVNPDHTMYLTPKVLRTMAQKCGLKVTKISYAHFPFIKKSLFYWFNYLLCRITSDKFKENFIAVLVSD